MLERTKLPISELPPPVPPKGGGSHWDKQLVTNLLLCSVHPPAPSTFYPVAGCVLWTLHRRTTSYCLFIIFIFIGKLGTILGKLSGLWRGLVGVPDVMCSASWGNRGKITSLYFVFVCLNLANFEFQVHFTPLSRNECGLRKIKRQKPHPAALGFGGGDDDWTESMNERCV